ncbi:helix-turn-helix domain containing protein [Mycobacteroides abscessus]|uniref:TetR/AcrR family transcriptional regulator n=1 Tax=Mycobacteroides abscessus TaxID=36809 RepID=UPI0005DE87A9|nr:TetR/AcrR family transcriptional regulator [Mycobacteroides abscessus]MDM2689772.1 helix-turn-helix domain containing protein [Mycobacteroides abscessus]MDO3105523.1 helix-turn-helix domain containing protein [Mycobacteroides abscessus subsp. abscessus]MDO3202301.1 helix-turn-helix domain containing protein [Mycobacteroides abscessus subsp. abscessus]CPU55298.1 TetR family transcriptional regulator [Mycobacteroides abscessus]
MIKPGKRALLPLTEVHADLPKRRDAVRNHGALLEAAAALIDERGTSSALTMDEVAQRAGVGKGTVFRRFGSRAGLMLALLDHSELELQRRIIGGKPPLGPGADPIERLVAFGHAKIKLMPVQGEMLIEAGEEIYQHGAYWVAVTHIEHLLKLAGKSDDSLLTAQFLMSALDPRLILRQLYLQKITLTRISRTWEQIARSVANSAE